MTKTGQMMHFRFSDWSNLTFRARKPHICGFNVGEILLRFSAVSRANFKMGVGSLDSKVNSRQNQAEVWRLEAEHKICDFMF